MFGWDPRWKSYYVRRGATGRVHLPVDATGLAAISFNFRSIHYDTYFVRFIPTVTQLLEVPSKGFLDVKLAHSAAAEALASHLQTMENVILKKAER